MSASPIDREIIDEFLFESRESLRDVESTLMDLERARIAARGPLDRAPVDRVFRTFHSIKGTAGFLGFGHLVAVTHVAESLLDLVRTGQRALGEGDVTALCEALDFSNAAMDSIEKAGGDDGLVERAEVVRALLLSVVATPSPAGAPAAPKVEAAAAPPPSASVASTVEAAAVPPPSAAPKVEAAAAPPPFAFAASAPPAVSAPVAPPAPIASAPAAPRAEAAPPAPPSAVHAPSAAAPPPAVDHAAARDDGHGPRRGAEPRGEDAGEARQAIRVDVDKLDALMNAVGELILAENAVAHNDAAEGLAAENETYAKSVMHLDRVTRSLQDIAMSMRMSPIRGVFRRMLRVVRDLGQRLGKDVNLELVGEETEVDRNLVEAIADPLVHIVRNAMDHGIESAEERVAAGKPASGTIRLEARHQGGEVCIQVSDDGRGLNRDKLLAKAQRQGLVPEGASLSEREILELIFHPGFSTAEKVTDVSGRGVGMDVVRRNIEAVRGHVEVGSALGRGTQVTLRVPLTLAIIDGMLVQVGQRRYTLPLFAVRESVAGRAVTPATLPSGSEVVQVRDSVLPLVRLGDLHAIPDAARQLGEGILMLVDSGGRTVALLVDRIVGQRQTVVKGMPPYLGALPGVSGCSILDTGDITLILDPKTLIDPTRYAA